MRNCIILTPELVEKRIHARRHFPNAEFLPGDPCPYGKEVVRENGEAAIVLRKYKITDVSLKDDYNNALLEHWWVIQVDASKYGGEKFKALEVLEYPPCLKSKK